MNDDALFDAAAGARDRAHSPYSGYRVGAAVIDENGRLHLGCNVENASYPEGICAEANAIGAMVAAGGRRIVSIAVVGAADRPDNAFTAGTICTPCGGCRQRIAEFADAGTRILLRDADGEILTRRIDDLLPETFSPKAG